MRLKREFRKLAASFGAAFSGIRLAVRNERNFRIHMCMIVYVLIFAWLGEVSGAKLTTLILCFGLVTAAELVNSAIELLCDVVTDRFDTALRAIKDMAAGAVLMCAICAAAVGLYVFLSVGVFCNIIARIIEMPYAAVAIVLSVPLAVLFTIKKRGK